MKVLIIDDDKTSQTVAKARLKKEQLEVLCATDGPEGLTVAAETKPDLILLDVSMPGMSGFDVCKQLKLEPELYTIPVIFLTAADNTDDKIRGLALGAVDYITKPFDAFELRARVKAALRTKRFEDMLMERAHVDPLTELPNRRALAQHLQREWARVERQAATFSFIMMDLDRFKEVNDRYGHSVGDQVLKEVARVISDRSRRMDVPSRYGGEEFAILVPNEAAGTAARLAERCRRGIEKLCIHFDGGDVQITASFGVADSTAAKSPEGLIEMADRALYDAKEAGRNTVRCAGQGVSV